MKNKKNNGQSELAKKGNLILAMLLIHFVFFGYIALHFGKNIGEEILFVYQIMFNPETLPLLLILMGIIILMVFRESFYEFGIRYAIWLVPFIIIESWIWFIIITKSFDLQFLTLTFTNIDGYLNILILLGVNFAISTIASILKENYKLWIKKRRGIEI